ncbi:MAG: hypothetical protein QG671_4028, partial [Actinomycetota bacterium]|nr:hypothetical protein [Actinomycetota bacterium]
CWLDSHSATAMALLISSAGKLARTNASSSDCAMIGAELAAWVSIVEAPEVPGPAALNVGSCALPAGAGAASLARCSTQPPRGIDVGLGRGAGGLVDSPMETVAAIGFAAVPVVAIIAGTATKRAAVADNPSAPVNVAVSHTRLRTRGAASLPD